MATPFNDFGFTTPNALREILFHYFSFPEDTKQFNSYKSPTFRKLKFLITFANRYSLEILSSMFKFTISQDFNAKIFYFDLARLVGQESVSGKLTIVYVAFFI